MLIETRNIISLMEGKTSKGELLVEDFTASSEDLKIKRKFFKVAHQLIQSTDGLISFYENHVDRHPILKKDLGLAKRLKQRVEGQLTSTSNYLEGKEVKEIENTQTELPFEEETTPSPEIKPRGIIKESIDKDKVRDSYDSIISLINQQARQLNDDECWELHEMLKAWTNKLI